MTLLPTQLFFGCGMTLPFGAEHRTKLAPWIGPQHLSDDAIAAAAERYRGTPDRFIVLDDFLAPTRLAAIRRLVLAEGIMEPAHKVYGLRGFVDQDTFEEAPEDKRFLTERIYRSPKPEHAFGEPALMDLSFRRMLRSAHFHALLRAVTGSPVVSTGLINLKWLDRGHFLKRHGDDSPGRLACMVLYVHEGWRPEYRGRFIMHCRDGRREIVEPLTNRLILFDPFAGTEHEVEPMAEDMGEWVRINYSVWFYEQQSEAD